MSSIPRLLHQTWKTKTGLPEHFAFWSDSFDACNPGIERRIYDDADNRALLAETFPQLLPLYDAFPREIFRVDFIRPVYLFRFGGVYADMDFQCLQPLDAIFDSDSDIVLGRMGTNEAFAHSIPNAIMFSRPAQGFWLGFLACMERAWLAAPDAFRVAPEHVTGPVVLREAVLAWLECPDMFRRTTAEFVARHGLEVNVPELAFGSLSVLPGHVLYPLDWNDRVHRMFKEDMLRRRQLYSRKEARRLFRNSLAVTYWTHSWGSAEPRKPGLKAAFRRARKTLRQLLGKRG